MMPYFPSLEEDIYPYTNHRVLRHLGDSSYDSLSQLCNHWLQDALSQILALF